MVYVSSSCCFQLGGMQYRAHQVRWNLRLDSFVMTVSSSSVPHGARDGDPRCHSGCTMAREGRGLGSSLSLGGKGSTSCRNAARVYIYTHTLAHIHTRGPPNHPYYHVLVGAAHASWSRTLGGVYTLGKEVELRVQLFKLTSSSVSYAQRATSLGATPTLGAGCHMFTLLCRKYRGWYIGRIHAGRARESKQARQIKKCAPRMRIGMRHDTWTAVSTHKEGDTSNMPDPDWTV